MNGIKIAIAQIIVGSLVDQRSQKDAMKAVDWVLRNYGNEIEGIALNATIISGKVRFGKFNTDEETEEIKANLASISKTAQKQIKSIFEW